MREGWCQRHADKGLTKVWCLRNAACKQISLSWRLKAQQEFSELGRDKEQPERRVCKVRHILGQQSSDPALGTDLRSRIVMSKAARSPRSWGGGG